MNGSVFPILALESKLESVTTFRLLLRPIAELWSLLVGVKTWELKSVNTAPSLTYSRTDMCTRLKVKARLDQSTGSGGRLPGLNLGSVFY